MCYVVRVVDDVVDHQCMATSVKCEITLPVNIDF